MQERIAVKGGAAECFGDTYCLRSQKAFSLVEVLVIIAVLAVLVVIALPALRSVREQAKASKSSSNLRQISGAFQLYIIDNDQEYPKVANNYPTGQMWLQEIWPYFYPETRFPGWDNLGGTVFYSPFAEGVVGERSYGMNYVLELSQESRRYGFLPSPVKTALAGDTRTTSSFKPVQVNYRNNGRAGVLYLDGHVALLEPGEVPDKREVSLFWNGTLD